MDMRHFLNVISQKEENSSWIYASFLSKLTKRHYGPEKLSLYYWSVRGLPELYILFCQRKLTGSKEHALSNQIAHNSSGQEAVKMKKAPKNPPWLSTEVVLVSHHRTFSWVQVAQIDYTSLWLILGYREVRKITS